MNNPGFNGKPQANPGDDACGLPLNDSSDRQLVAVECFIVVRSCDINIRRVLILIQATFIWSAVTRYRFLFQVIWLRERRSFVLPTSPEMEMECTMFCYPN